ncbi:hypothetical protein CYY_005506 [Polysphondylium violaceum]|uniref:Uncharacterized protein n=1 Tax=Polysphondylium violaceum TaxID=133409 RepID=A0A8J4PUZ3_9MYCE|nr:hypothetical protein CYY_005506 [Polysphondylium violaceum]
MMRRKSRIFNYFIIIVSILVVLFVLLFYYHYYLCNKTADRRDDRKHLSSLYNHQNDVKLHRYEVIHIQLSNNSNREEKDKDKGKDADSSWNKYLNHYREFVSSNYINNPDIDKLKSLVILPVPSKKVNLQQRSLFNITDSMIDNHQFIFTANDEYKSDYDEHLNTDTLTIDLYSLADIDTLVKLLFKLHNQTNRSIFIFGPCTLKQAVEKKLDRFLASKRLWTYMYSLDYCRSTISNGNGNKEYGLLVYLRRFKIPFGNLSNFYSTLDALQFRCRGRVPNENTRLLYHIAGDKGMFSTLHFLSYSLTRSLDWYRTLVVQDNLLQFANRFDDIILPISDCKRPSFEKLTEKPDLIQRLNGISKKEYNNDTWVSLIDSDYRVYLDFLHTNQNVPAQEYFQTTFTLRSHVMNWLLRPNHKTRQSIQMAKEKLWLTNNNNNNNNNNNYHKKARDKCITLHVRNGDKVTEANITYFEQYMDKVVEISNHGIIFKDIFLMTDNKTLLDQSFLGRFKPFKFHYLDIHRFDSVHLITKKEKEQQEITIENEQNFNIQEPAKKDNNKKKQHDIGLGLLVETMIAVTDCNYLLGSFSSNIARGIVELIHANTDQNPDNIFNYWLSLDGSKWTLDP